MWKTAHASAASKAMALEADKGQLSAEVEHERRRVSALREADERRQRDEEQRHKAAAAAAAARHEEESALPDKLARIRGEGAPLPGTIGTITDRVYGRRDVLSPARASATATDQATVMPDPTEARQGGRGGRADPTAVPRTPQGGEGMGRRAHAALVVPDLDEVERSLRLETIAVQHRLREHSDELLDEARQIEQFRAALASRAASAASAPPSNPAANARATDGRGAPMHALPPSSLGRTPRADPDRGRATSPAAAAGGGRRTTGSASTYELRSLTHGMGPSRFDGGQRPPYDSLPHPRPTPHPQTQVWAPRRRGGSATGATCSRAP